MKRIIDSSVVDFLHFAVRAVSIGSSASSVKKLFAATRVSANKANIYMKLNYKSFTFVTIPHLDSTLALKKYKFLD